MKMTAAEGYGEERTVEIAGPAASRPETAGRVLILQGSPRHKGNTAQLAGPFEEELRRLGCECRSIFLYDKEIRGCVSCLRCQQIRDGFGCSLQDKDMWEVFREVMEVDLVVLATPIYSWYCTPPMKAVLDRLVYGMNKYFGGGERLALGAGKKLALIMTCGYPPERGSDLLEEGIRRFCRHSRMEFVGAVTERNEGYDKAFMDEGKEARIREFAGKCAGALRRAAEK